MPTINPSITACFTGPLPRNLYWYEHDEYIPIVEALKSIVTALHNREGFVNFITGGAQGIDQLAFWAVNRMKADYCLPLQNFLFLPFVGFNDRWREHGLFSKDEFKVMLNHADDTQYISDEAGSTAFLARNRAMVNCSSIVIGVYPDDSWTRGDRMDPGTTYTLQYAMKQGKRVMVLNPHTLEWKIWR